MGKPSVGITFHEELVESKQEGLHNDVWSHLTTVATFNNMHVCEVRQMNPTIVCFR